MREKEKKLIPAMMRTVLTFLTGVIGAPALSHVVEESGTGRENARLMENLSVPVSALVQYKSLSLARQSSAQSGVTGVGGAAAQ